MIPPADVVAALAALGVGRAPGGRRRRHRRAVLDAGLIDRLQLAISPVDSRLRPPSAASRTGGPARPRPSAALPCPRHGRRRPVRSQPHAFGCKCCPERGNLLGRVIVEPGDQPCRRAEFSWYSRCSPAPRVPPGLRARRRCRPTRQTDRRSQPCSARRSMPCSRRRPAWSAQMVAPVPTAAALALTDRPERKDEQAQSYAGLGRNCYGSYALEPI